MYNIIKRIFMRYFICMRIFRFGCRILYILKHIQALIKAHCNVPTNEHYNKYIEILLYMYVHIVLYIMMFISVSHYVLSCIFKITKA